MPVACAVFSADTRTIRCIRCQNCSLSSKLLCLSYVVGTSLKKWMKPWFQTHSRAQGRQQHQWLFEVMANWNETLSCTRTPCCCLVQSDFKSFCWEKLSQRYLLHDLHYERLRISYTDSDTDPQCNPCIACILKNGTYITQNAIFNCWQEIQVRHTSHS